MKTVNTIVKILSALAAVAGAVYIIATYGEQITAWAKKALASLPKCPCCKEDAPEVYPGEPLAKDPTVTNVGSNPCFVRISVANLKQFGNKGDITYRTGYVTGALGTDWVLHTDGYFYYTKVLAVNEATPALFDQIVMPTGLTGNEDTQPITVTAQAVQAQGAKPSFTAVQAMTVEEIAAWFTTCGMV